MRVLHLVKTAVGGTWALRQMEALVGLDTDVHVAIPEGPLVDKYRSAGVTVHLLQTDFPVTRPWHFRRLARRFRELVEQVHPDIIHSHFVGTTLTMRLALGPRNSPPRIFQVPGPLHLENAVFRNAELATAGACDYWIASCKWTRHRYHQSGVSPERTFLSYYGIDTSSFRRRPPGRLRQELSLSKDTRIVGMVAYMYAPRRYLGQSKGLKGHEDFIDALALVRRTRRDVVGVFIGGAWNGAHSYERRVRDYGKRRCGDGAIFLGTRSDVAELYSDLDVVVHPSRSENLGGALESLALAVPTIATNVGGFPDLVTDHETGWLVPPKSPTQITGAIMDAFSDPKRAAAMAKRGNERVRALCDLSKTAREVRQTYELLTA